MATRTPTTSVDRAANWILSQSWSTLAVAAAIAVGASIAIGSYAPANLIGTALVGTDGTSSRQELTQAATGLGPVSDKLEYAKATGISAILKTELVGVNCEFEPWNCVESTPEPTPQPEPTPDPGQGQAGCTPGGEGCACSSTDPRCQEGLACSNNTCVIDCSLGSNLNHPACGGSIESPKPSPGERGISCFKCENNACVENIVLSNACPAGSSPTGCDDSCVMPLPGVTDLPSPLPSAAAATGGVDCSLNPSDPACGNATAPTDTPSPSSDSAPSPTASTVGQDCTYDTDCGDPAAGYRCGGLPGNKKCVHDTPSTPNPGGSCQTDADCPEGNDEYEYKCMSVSGGASSCQPVACEENGGSTGFKLLRLLANEIFIQVHAQGTGGLPRSQPCYRALLARIANGSLQCDPADAAACAADGGKGCFKDPSNGSKPECFTFSNANNPCINADGTSMSCPNGMTCSACFGGCVKVSDFCNESQCASTGGVCSHITLSCVPSANASCTELCGRAGLSCVGSGETAQCIQDRCGGRTCPSGQTCDKATGQCSGGGFGIVEDACALFDAGCPAGYTCKNVDSGDGINKKAECQKVGDPTVKVAFDPCDRSIPTNRDCPPETICVNVGGFAECKLPPNSACDSYEATGVANDCVDGATCKRNASSGVGQCTANYGTSSTNKCDATKACPAGMACAADGLCKINRSECSTDADCKASGLGLKVCRQDTVNNVKRCGYPDANGDNRPDIDACYLVDILNDSKRFGLSTSEILEISVLLQGQKCERAGTTTFTVNPAGLPGLQNVNGRYLFPVPGSLSGVAGSGATAPGGNGNRNRNVNGTPTTSVKIVADPGKGTCTALEPGSGWVMHTGPGGSPGSCPADCSIIRMVPEAEKDVGPEQANHPVNICYRPNPANKSGSDVDDAYCRKADGTPDESKCEKVCVGAYNGGYPEQSVDRQGCFYIPKSAAGLNSCPIQTTGFKRGNSTWGGINVDPTALEAYERGRADFCAANDFCTVPLADGSNPPSGAAGVDDSGKFAVCKCVNGFPSCSPQVESGCRENVGKGVMVYNPNGANSSWWPAPPPGCSFQTSSDTGLGARTPTPTPGGTDSTRLSICPDVTSSTSTTQCKYPIHPWYNLTSNAYPSSTSDRVYAVFGGPNTFVPASCWRIQEYIPGSAADNNPWGANLIEVGASASTDSPGFFSRVWNWIKGILGLDESSQQPRVSLSADMLTAGLIEDCMEHTKIGIGQERRTGSSVGTGVSNRGECRALFPTYYNADGSPKTQAEICQAIYGNPECTDGNGVRRDAVTTSSYSPPVIPGRRYYAVPTCSGSGPSPLNPNYTPASPTPTPSASARPSSSPSASASPATCGSSCPSGQCKQIAGYGPFCVAQNSCANAPSPCGAGKHMCVTDEGQWSCTTAALRPAGATCIICDGSTPSPTPRPSSSPSASASPVPRPTAPGGVASFSISLPSSMVVGVATDMTVCAKDKNGATVPGYRGTVVKFIAEDTSATSLPSLPRYTFTAGDNGCHTFTKGVTLVYPGESTVVVMDVDYSDSVYGIKVVNGTVSGGSPTPTATPNCSLDPAHPFCVGMGGSPSPSPSGLTCPTDLKLCPDGSYVGRTRPNCEFAACPTTGNSNVNSGACSAEAKLCPDGSVVSRVKPNCEFAACQKVLGDVNGDGRITIVDVVMITDFLAGKPGVTLSSEQFLLADVTCDRLLNLADVAKIANFIITGTDGVSRTLTCGPTR